MNKQDFYINGKWQTPNGRAIHNVINPSDLTNAGQIILGNKVDVDYAVAAAKNAFNSYSQTSLVERRELISEINAQLIKRNDEIAAAITAEMGAPLGLSRGAQAPSGPQHFGEMLNVIDSFKFEGTIGKSRFRKEAIGVCALITPWNWPLNQIATKVAPALAAGCTMVLKPSENAPLDAIILAEIMHEVGVPKGVFNLIHGDGIGVGAPLTSHKDVDMVSFTGSTRAGIAISHNGADTIKRISLELGGKSASIVLEDADLEKSVLGTLSTCMSNTGQSCNAPTRMFVPENDYDKVCDIIRSAISSYQVGDPKDAKTNMGPISNSAQFKKVRALIQTGIDEGAALIAGGLEKPIEAGDLEGYFVQPTVFGNVTPDMSIFKEEIFGPVLSITTYETLEHAIDMANQSEYGLSGYVWGNNQKDVYKTASALRTGMVHLNGASLDAAAPFGGYKMSGNGREWGEYGLEEFLETKSLYGA